MINFHFTPEGVYTHDIQNHDNKRGINHEPVEKEVTFKIQTCDTIEYNIKFPFGVLLRPSKDTHDKLNPLEKTWAFWVSSKF